MHGVGNPERLHVGERLQATLTLDERAVLDQHAQHLLEEEGVAAGCAADGFGSLLIKRAGEILEQLRCVFGL